MGEAQGPKPQVGSGVGDAAEAVLYGVYGLMHRHVGKVKLWTRPNRQMAFLRIKIKTVIARNFGRSSALEKNPKPEEKPTCATLTGFSVSPNNELPS